MTQKLFMFIKAHVVVRAYSRHFDPYDAFMTDEIRYRPLAAKIPPDMVESSRMATLQECFYTAASLAIQELGDEDATVRAWGIFNKAKPRYHYPASGMVDTLVDGAERIIGDMYRVHDSTKEPYIKELAKGIIADMSAVVLPAYGLSPTGRVVNSSPEMQDINPHRSTGKTYGKLVDADFSDLEERILASNTGGVDRATYEAPDRPRFLKKGRS